MEWLFARLGELFHPLARAFAAGKPIGTVAGFVLILVALALLGYAVFRLGVAFVRPAATSAGARRATPLAAERSAADWRALAAAAALRGEFAHAIAALFAAALAALDARAIVPFDAARTPGEYRRLVRRDRRALAEPFDDLTERFVRATYAAEPAGSGDYESALGAFVRLEPLIG